MKIAILKELGYETKGYFIMDSEGKPVRDEYIDDYVRFDNMLILPGSAIIIDNNPLSIASYMDDYGDIL